RRRARAQSTWKLQDGGGPAVGTLGSPSVPGKRRKPLPDRDPAGSGPVASVRESLEGGRTARGRHAHERDRASRRIRGARRPRPESVGSTAYVAFRGCRHARAGGIIFVVVLTATANDVVPAPVRKLPV